MFRTNTGKAQQQNDLTTILNELNDDIVQSEIYNPFTPVVSPTTDQPQIVDKIFVQTSSGYRAVDNNLYYKSPNMDDDADSNKWVRPKLGSINELLLNYTFFLFSFYSKLFNQKLRTTLVCRSKDLDQHIKHLPWSSRRLG